MHWKKGGYHCNGPCLNNNTHYDDLPTAWAKCKLTADCSKIFRWENGSHYKYYLRKENDTYVDDPRFLHVDFDPKCNSTGKGLLRK